MEDRSHKNNGSCRDINIAVLGAKNVGKSAMIVRFLTGRFIGDYDSQMEAVFSTHLPVGGKQCKVNIMDTATHVPDQHVKQDPVTWADCIMLVFSLTDSSSFDATQDLLHDLRKLRKDERFPILVAANKSDLVHLRAVNLIDVETWSEEQGCLFCEVSASEEPDSVKNAFCALCKQARKVTKKREKLSWTLQRPAVAARLQIRQSLKNLAEKKIWRSRTSTF